MNRVKTQIALLSIVVLVLAVSSISPLYATPSKPKLIVNITVAGLRYDYLLKYNKGMNPEGIAKLTQEGVSCPRAIIDYLGTSTAVGVASIASGSTPSSHGVIGTHYFDYTTSKRIMTCYDKEVNTIGADELDAQVSPRGLVATTIGDCIKDLSPASKVVSIALNPISAVVAGGFLADDCYWVSPRDGKIVTSSYYTNRLPDWVNEFNEKELANAYSAVKWKTCRPTEAYYNVLSQDIIKGEGLTSFENFLSSDKYSFERLSTTPAATVLLRDFAIQTIVSENLGKDNSTDYISIVFDNPALTASKYGSESIEAEDAIYRLDDEIASLLSFLESYIGKDELLIVFSGAHGTSNNVSENSRLPSGEFNSSQFEILINGFLGAQITSQLSAEMLAKISGDSRWVLDFSSGQLYLNRRKIFEAGLKLEDIQNMVAQFAIQFRGVASAVTSTTLQSGQFTEGLMGMSQRSYFARHSGDVILNMLPGWITNQGSRSFSGSPYIYDTHVPVIFWGGGIEPRVIDRTISLQDIAPTISALVGVTPPNTSTGNPIFYR